MPAPALIPVIAPLLKMFGKKSLMRKSGGKMGGLGLSMDTFKSNAKAIAPSKSQTNWILIVSIIVFFFMGMVFLTYTLLEDFDGSIGSKATRKVTKSKRKSRKTKQQINKRYNQYVFGSKEGFNGLDIDSKRHLDIDNIDSKRHLQYNMQIKRNKVMQK
jgi:hypothetical protein